MSALEPLVIKFSATTLRTFPLYVTPSRNRSFAVTYEQNGRFDGVPTLLGDRLENPSELVFSVYIEEVNLSLSYATAYAAIEDAHTATSVEYHEGVQLVDGLLGAGVVPDGLAVRLTLRFAPTKAALQP